jgi:hypothetical protein
MYYVYILYKIYYVLASMPRHCSRITEKYFIFDDLNGETVNGGQITIRQTIINIEKN